MSREAYFSSEGRAHFNEDDMLFYSVPWAVDLAPYPPTFIKYNKKSIKAPTMYETPQMETHTTLKPSTPNTINYNINIVETYDVNEIYDYVSTLFDNKTATFIDDLTQLAIEKLRENINLTVKEAVDLAFSEINHIYGGSASDLINEEVV